MSAVGSVGSAPKHDDLADFAREVYEFLSALDPAVWRDEASAQARETLDRVRRRAEQFVAAWRDVPPRDEADVRVRSAVTAFQEALPKEEIAGKSAWVRLRDELAPRYEAIAAAIRQLGAPVQHLTPTNLPRTLVHVASGVTLSLLWEHVFVWWTALACTIVWVVWAWTLEVVRQRSDYWNDKMMAFFGPVTRAHERYRVNAATWYGTAILLLVLTTPDYAGVMGLLALAFGDPAAGTIGRAYGTVRLPGGKSLEGALAFSAATFAVTACYLVFYHEDLGAGPILVLAATAGVVGAATEVLSTRIQDNFSIPVFTAWGVTAMKLAMGL